MDISSSVGFRGINALHNVRTVQQYLRDNGYQWLKVDGLVGIDTIKAIKMFQSRFMAYPDGRIDLHGTTLRHMIKKGAAPSHISLLPAANNNHPNWDNCEFSGRLTVKEGQVTFNAEGNDIAQSIFFSRHIHWPGGKSGVTLGRGYDMGGRSKGVIISDLVRAGVPREQAALFAEGHGKIGSAAHLFVKNYRHACGIISRESQARLFELIYPGYVKSARHLYNLDAQKYNHNAVQWDKLHKAIREVIVDFVYQGLSRISIIKQCMTNDFDSLIHFIKTDKTVSQYEPGRDRAGYLRRNKK